MPDTQISEDMVDAFIAGFNSGVFDRPAFNLPVDERCRCGQCLQEEADARSTVRAALEAALSGHVVVPQSALDWLFGEGPDADGKWFGETIGDGIPKLAGRYPRTYWWRSKFRAMIQAAPPVASGHVVGWRTMDSAPKDGTWFLAYRPPSADWETLVVIGWDEESNDFVWPTENYDAYDPPDLNKRDAAGYIEVDVYESQGSFTHWQPLPAPPVPVEPNP